MSVKKKNKEAKMGSAEIDYLVAYNVLVDTENDNYDIWVVDPLSRESKNITNHSDVAWGLSKLWREGFFL